MLKTATTWFILLITLYLPASELPSNALKKGDIYGIIVDGTDGRPVEYATVALYSLPGDNLITGGISANDGYFILKNAPAGNYYLTVTFMGYKTKRIDNIKVAEQNKGLDLGRISIYTSTTEIEAVNVVADQSSVQYKIDKKVVNVSQQLTAISGTAVDILENVPSVKVDIDGNVSLRGSTNFTVLIDGRPSVLDASDALAQIPAGAIDNIEIITNPSAKYEPEGTSGIINIITKKNKLDGVSGIVNASAGRFGQFGGDATIDIRNNKLHYYVAADYNVHNRIGSMEYYRWSRISGDTLRHIQNSGDNESVFNRWGARGGIDYSISDNDVIGFSGRIGRMDMQQSSDMLYDQWDSPINIHSFYTTDDNSTRDGYFYSGNLNYKHTFGKNKDHYLEAKIDINSRDIDSYSENFTINSLGKIIEGKQADESGPSINYRFNVDYAQPFAFGGKLEAGGQMRVASNNEDNNMFDYDTVTNAFVFIDKYSNKTNYTDNIYAAYGLFAAESGNFGYQIGLRMEYTYRYIKLLKTGEDFKIDQPDFFPTLHFSYKLPANQESMVSFTRRINRPRGWSLEPFITYVDANNVRKGNPGLLPEYINSFDLGYQKKFKQNFVSAEVYYRITQNKSERIMSQWDQNPEIILQTEQNVGTDYSLGVELMANYSPTKWYTANIMWDMYKYNLVVDYDALNYTQANFSWSARFNNSFRITQTTRLQFDLMYNSPSVRAQGKTESFFVVNTAVKQDFFKRKLSATLQVRDVFGTMGHKFQVVDDNIYQSTTFTPKTPMVMLTLSYKINNYKINRESMNNNNIDLEENTNGY